MCLGLKTLIIQFQSEYPLKKGDYDTGVHLYLIYVLRYTTYDPYHSYIKLSVSLIGRLSADRKNKSLPKYPRPKFSLHIVYRV
jgi:hypothetical protein